MQYKKRFLSPGIALCFALLLAGLPWQVSRADDPTLGTVSYLYVYYGLPSYSGGGSIYAFFTGINHACCGQEYFPTLSVVDENKLKATTDQLWQVAAPVHYIVNHSQLVSYVIPNPHPEWGPLYYESLRQVALHSAAVPANFDLQYTVATADPWHTGSVVFPIVNLPSGPIYHLIGPLNLGSDYNGVFDPDNPAGAIAGLTVNRTSTFQYGSCSTCLGYDVADVGNIDWDYKHPQYIPIGPGWVLWVDSFPSPWSLHGDPCPTINPGHGISAHALPNSAPGGSKYCYYYYDHFDNGDNIGFANINMTRPWGEPQIDVVLNPEYSSLPFMSSNISKPDGSKYDTQTLYATIHGGLGAPYHNVELHVRNPLGVERSWTQDFDQDTTITHGTVGDSYFGVDERGQWTAWLQVSSGTQTVRSNTATWMVEWYRVIEAH